MNTTEMRTHYKCSQCNTNYPTKNILDHHTSVCKFMHTSYNEHSIEKYYREIQIPSQESMAHYLFHLTRKYEELEQKFTKLQQSVISTRRKSVQEYLEQLSPPNKSFIDWTTSIEIPDHILEILFKTDLKNATRNLFDIIFDNQDLPLQAFSQKSNTFYLYDKSAEWRAMTGEEFTKWIEKIEHKFLKKFNHWTKDQEIDTPQAQEKIVAYMAKVNGIKQPNRVSDIKKWLYSKIAVSLKQIIV